MTEPVRLSRADNRMNDEILAKLDEVKAAIMAAAVPFEHRWLDAEALREADELLCDFQTNFGVLPPDDEDDRAAWERIEKCRKTLAAHAAEAAQAQSGDMVTFVHRVLEHFPIDANGYFLPLSANRLAFAIEKSHAAAPQQAAEPVGWASHAGLKELAANRAESENGADAIEAAISSHPFGDMNVAVYTHPQPAKSQAQSGEWVMVPREPTSDMLDAASIGPKNYAALLTAAPQPQPAQGVKDAARYRFAQTHDGFAVCRWDETAGPECDGEYIPIDDEDVDAAMAKESGR